MSGIYLIFILFASSQQMSMIVWTDMAVSNQYNPPEEMWSPISYAIENYNKNISIGIKDEKNTSYENILYLATDIFPTGVDFVGIIDADVYMSSCEIKNIIDKYRDNYFQYMRAMLVYNLNIDSFDGIDDDIETYLKKNQYTTIILGFKIKNDNLEYFNYHPTSIKFLKCTCEKFLEYSENQSLTFWNHSYVIIEDSYDEFIKCSKTLKDKKVTYVYHNLDNNYSSISTSFTNVASFTVTTYICHSTCLACNGPNDNDCLSCRESEHYTFNTLINKCLLSCPSYVSTVSQLGASCVCDNSSYVFDAKNWLCYIKCDPGLIYNDTLKICQCENSSYGLSIYSNAMRCAACSDGYELTSDGICNYKCSEGFIMNLTTRLCTKIGAKLYSYGEFLSAVVVAVLILLI